MKHWLIVGASRGFGLALARTVVAKGEQVTALAHRSNPEHAALAARHAGRLRFVSGDVRSEPRLEQVAKELASDTRFDVLVYNAAIHLEHERSDVEQASSADILETLDVNAVGAVRAIKHFRRFVADDGLLLLISSEAGSISAAARPSEYGYCMSKAALNMFAKLLANRERQRGSRVEVLALHPGWMRTDMGGPAADISAEEAAESVLATLEARAGTRGAPFVDRTGKALAW